MSAHWELKFREAQKEIADTCTLYEAQLAALRTRITELEAENERVWMIVNHNSDIAVEFGEKFALAEKENERLQKAVELGTNLANYIADDSDVVMKDGKNVCENCQFNARAYLSKYGKE